MDIPTVSSGDFAAEACITRMHNRLCTAIDPSLLKND